MKQKNMVLVGVAVGFGLLAALLATQMNAKPQENVVNEVDLPVAGKEVPINTKLTKDILPNYVSWKKFRKDALPPGEYATTEEQLENKRVTRTVREGELFSLPELSNKALVEIPPGYDMMTFGINREKIVGGFAPPGSKVDILATVRLNKLNRSITFPLLTDMLILAVDVNTAPLPGQVPSTSVSDVSMAVTKEQARLIHAAIGRGADMRLILLGQVGSKDKEKGLPSIYEHPLTKDEVWQILTDEYGETQTEGTGNKPAEKDTFVTVQLPVPKVDLPAGTKLTKDVIDTKFTVIDIKPPAPENVVKDIRSYTGQYLQKDLTANQFVPMTFLGDESPSKPKPVEPVVETPKPPPVYWDVTVQTASGVQKFRYQKKDDGKYIYLGQLKVEEDPEAEKNKPTAKPEAKPEPKGATY